MNRIAANALLCLLASGCGRSEVSKRAEVAAVTVAIDRLRDAPNPNKSTLLAELDRTACTLKDVCDTKQLCADAYRLQVETLAQIERLKSGSLDAGQLPEQFGTLQAQLLRARDGAKACVTAEATLLDRYRAGKGTRP